MRVIRGEGLETVRYNNNRGVGIIGGGCLEKPKIVVFLGKYVSFIFLCEHTYLLYILYIFTYLLYIYVMLLMHLLLNSCSVEWTS